MAAIAEELKIVIRTEMDKALKNFKKLDKKMDVTGDRMEKMGRIASRVGGMLVAAFGARQLLRMGQDMVRAAGVQEQAIATLEAAILSTGGAAGLTSVEMQDMASALQRVTKFGDEATIEAQALLLTFTKIGRDVFPDATVAILNMSTAMRQDLKASTLMVGKALQDPILGLTALSRAGVQFTEDQKKVVKSFVDVGDVAAAQRLILAELETQFGGVAEAAAEVATAAMVQLGNSLGDLQEIGGSMIAMFLEPSVRFFTALADEAAKAWGRLIAVAALFDEAGYAKAAGDIGLAKRAYEQLTEEIERLERAQKAGIPTGGRTRKQTEELISEMYQTRWELFEDIRDLEKEAKRRAEERKAEEERITAELKKQREEQERIATAQRVARDFAAKLDTAFEKTKSRVELVEKELAYWQAITDTKDFQEEQRQAVIAMLEEELLLLEAVGDELEDQEDTQARNRDLVKKTGETLSQQEPIATKLAQALADRIQKEKQITEELEEQAELLKQQEQAMQILNVSLDMAADLVVAFVEGGEQFRDALWDAASAIADRILPGLGAVLRAIKAITDEMRRKQQEALDAIQEANDKARQAAEDAGKARVAFEEKWLDKYESISLSKLEILENEYQEALDMAEELGADVADVILYFEKLIADEKLRIFEEELDKEEQAFKDKLQKRIDLLEAAADKEREIMDERIREIEEEFDNELYLLRRLLDENVINVAEYLDRLAGLQEGRELVVEQAEQAYDDLITALDALTTALETGEITKGDAINLRGRVRPKGHSDFAPPPLAGMVGPSVNYNIEVSGAADPEATALAVTNAMKTLDRRRRV